MSLHVLDHPLIHENLAIIRDKHTTAGSFRSAVDTLTGLMAYPLTEQLPETQTTVLTPLMEAKVARIASPIVLVPILRAGLGMLAGMQQMIPEAAVGVLGMARNEKTLMPEVYYAKFPDKLSEAEVIVLDPMLATGGSAAEALTELKAMGAKHLRMACLVATPEGVSKLTLEHPDVDIYTCALDSGLNAQGYILPGLGDAGDRLFGTEVVLQDEQHAK